MLHRATRYAGPAMNFLFRLMALTKNIFKRWITIISKSRNGLPALFNYSFKNEICGSSGGITRSSFIRSPPANWSIEGKNKRWKKEEPSKASSNYSRRLLFGMQQYIRKRREKSGAWDAKTRGGGKKRCKASLCCGAGGAHDVHRRREKRQKIRGECWNVPMRRSLRAVGPSPLPAICQIPLLGTDGV